MKTADETENESKRFLHHGNPGKTSAPADPDIIKCHKPINRTIGGTYKFNRYKSNY